MNKKENQSLQDQIKRNLKKTNYYEILQLKNHASETQIKKSYKKLALKYHPDKNSAQGSKQLFGKIVQAYDTLSNKQKRQIYDQSKKLKESKISQQEKYFKKSFNTAKENFQRQKNYYRQFQKMYQQEAKRERQQFKKQHENSNQSKKKKQQKEKPKNQSQFNFNKQNNFKNKTSNRPSFFQYKSTIDQEIRLQKQKQKIKHRLYKVQVAFFILVLWIFLYILGPAMKGTPYYSMNQSNQYKIKVQTQILKVPFFVKPQYFEQAKDISFKQNLQKKVDHTYIKALSKVCSQILNKEEETLQKLQKMKSKEMKKQLKNQLQSLDKSSCKILHDLRQIDPTYFLNLFKVKNKQF